MRRATIPIVFILMMGLIYFSISDSTSMDLADGNLGMRGHSPSSEHQDALENQRVSASMRVSPAAVGDKLFVDRTQVASIETDDQTQMDLWADSDADLLGNGTNWLIEVWVNETKTNRYLHIQAHRFDGSNIFSTQGFYLLNNCLNASVWASDKNGGWEVAVAGTWTTPGQPTGFLYSIAFTGIGTFSVNDLEDELLIDTNDTYITDLKQDHMDLDGWEEIVLCGFSMNSSSGFYDGLVQVWNSTGTALTLEHSLTHPNGTAHVKNTALDVGDLRGDHYPDLVVVGWVDNSGDATTYAAIHYYRGEDYSPNEGDWVGPFRTFFTTVSAMGFDVVIGDVDGDLTNETYVVGEIAAFALYLIVAQNWTDTQPVTEGFAAPTANGADASVAFEVEIVPAQEWDVSPMLALAVVGYITGEGYYMFTYLITYDTSGFGDYESQIRSQYSYVLLDNYCEIHIADLDANGDAEFWLCFSADDAGTRVRNDTVWSIGYDTIGQGKYHPPRDDSVIEGHSPTPGPDDDAPPWVAPGPDLLERFWVAYAWPTAWIGLVSALVIGLAYQADKEKWRSKLTLIAFGLAVAGLVTLTGIVFFAYGLIEPAVSSANAFSGGLFQ